jgi:hypothetical protein
MQSQKVSQLRKLSTLMDSQYTGPFGYKFGLDGLLGLIPVIGDFVTTAISIYIIFQAATLGCSPPTILRMGLNILIESLADMLPVVGNIFDFMWKSNNKNIDLVEQHLKNPQMTTLKSRFALGFVIVLILSVFIGSIALSVYLVKSILKWVALFSS